MLIDSFADIGFKGMIRREPDPLLAQFLLIDGAFVPGLHKAVADDMKAILFESLPGCSDEARDLSPFLTRFEPGDKTQASLLKRCSRWPMVSLIETRDSIKALSERLAAWCVVEADGQRFNFRFADTRRLPMIYRTLNPRQRGQFSGPAVHWSYVARDGQWRNLELDGSEGEVAHNPTLDQGQFASLVDDSRADEILALLRDRGFEVYTHPAKSHALVAMALRAAAASELDDQKLIDWCTWYWQEDQLHDDLVARLKLDIWRTNSN